MRTEKSLHQYKCNTFLYIIRNKTETTTMVVFSHIGFPPKNPGVLCVFVVVSLCSLLHTGSN